MGVRRLALDNPAFTGKLRYEHRSAAYLKRPLQSATISDMLVARVPQPTRPKPIHPTVPAASIHTQRTLAARPTVSTRPSTRPTSLRPSRQAKGLSIKLAHKHHLVLYALAVIVFVVGVFASLSGLRTNQQVAAQVSQLQKKTQPTDGSSSVAPSVTKPSVASISNYVVAPNLPRYIDITKLGVHARVLSMGVTAKDQLQAPGNVYDAGWYNASGQPGQPGAMLLDGHVSSWTTHGVFYGLDTLLSGDILTITKGDGKLLHYKVVKSALVDADKVDMAALLVSADTTKPGLNLISCAGDVIHGTNEFNKRMTVYAVLQ